MANKIKYIGYYDTNDNKEENRNYVLSARNKITYIVNAVAQSGKNVEVFSVSQSLNKKGCKRSTKEISSKILLKRCLCIGAGNVVKRVIDRFVIRLQLLYELIFNTTADDEVIVYHSLGYMKTIKFAKKTRKFKLILEVEEVYGDVIGSEKTVKNELNYFNIADKFIFPTELLNKKINSQDKPYVVIHGTYQVEADRKCKFNDGKIHAVYAGTFDPRKGGAAAASAAATHLDFNYHIHIIGFGNDDDKKNIQELISKISKTTDCVLTYDGLLSGEDYIKFLQSCDIGLSTQNPNAQFNETSFPSKVLSYMANGLRVVSIRIKVLETSAVNDSVYYYDDDTPQAIAEAIKKVNVNDNYDSRKRIEELDVEFIENLKRLL